MGVNRSHDNAQWGIGITGMTVEGRLFLQRLKAEERAESFIGKLKKPGTFVAGSVFGALATIIPDLVKLWLLQSDAV